MNENIEVNELIKTRKEKLETLRKNNKDPFKITKFNRTHTSSD